VLLEFGTDFLDAMLDRFVRLVLCAGVRIVPLLDHVTRDHARISADDTGHVYGHFT
jgi:hypothetical protein